MRLLFCNPKSSDASVCFCAPWTVSRQQQSARSGTLNYSSLCGNKYLPPASRVALWLCSARLMSSSLCKQTWQVWSHAWALPTKFDWCHSEQMVCLCNVCVNHAHAFYPPVFWCFIHRVWLKVCYLHCLSVCLEAVCCKDQMSRKCAWKSLFWLYLRYIHI